jgi:crossover junction endodeoxyribonuclease RuvC
MSAPTPLRILGVDPGSRITGFGLIEVAGSRQRCVAHDAIALPEGPLEQRLFVLFTRLRGLIAEHRPDEVAMEQVFVRHNVASALVLGQARGAALCAVAEAGLPLHEYAPASIKLAIAGNGRAEKAQIQRMVRVLLNLPALPAEDAADALACALCHAHGRTLKLRTQKALLGSK